MNVLTTQAEVDNALTDPNVKELDIVVPAGVVITVGGGTKWKPIAVSGPGQVIVDGVSVMQISNGGNVTVQNEGRVEYVGQGGVVRRLSEGGLIYTVDNGGVVLELRGTVYSVEQGGVVHTVGKNGVVTDCWGRIEYIGKEGQVHNVRKGGLVEFVDKDSHISTVAGVVKVNFGNIYALERIGVVEVNRGEIRGR